MNLPALLIGRIFLAIPFIVFGALHLMGADKMAGMVPSWVPGGVLWVYITGLAMLAAGVAFVLNKQAKLAGQLTALLMLIYILTLHHPGMMSAPDEMAAQMSLMAILKDFGLAGGALLIAHIAGEQK